MGSGSTLIGCALLNRKGIGVDIDENYCGLAKNRLINEAEMNQKKLWEDLKAEESGSGMENLQRFTI